jgi:hypothetical protein
MATPNDVAQRLGIDPSKVTARGLLERAFPGVVQCIPAGPSRDAFVDGLGASLLQAALDDDAGEPFRYNGQLQMIQHVLDQPEMQQILAKCQQQGGAPAQTPAQTPGATPGTTPAPTGAPGSADSGPGPIGWGTAAAALALTAAVGGMLWWVTQRGPGKAAEKLPGRSNPADPRDDGKPRMDAVTISGYEWVLSTPYMQSEPVLYLQPKPGDSSKAGSRKSRWAEVFPDSRTRPTVLIYRENSQGGEEIASDHVVESGWKNEKLRDFAHSLGPRFYGMGYAMWFAEQRIATKRNALAEPEKRKRRKIA